MSFPSQDIYKAIRSRALADTGAGGLFNVTTPLLTGWYSRLAPPNSAMPYVVVNIIDAGMVDAFAMSLRRLTVRMSLFTSGNSEANINTIRTRILGNWLKGINRVPSHGFERAKLTLTDDYNLAEFLFINQTELFEERATQTILEFETHVSKLASSP
jgi:hypothetical protein